MPRLDLENIKNIPLTKLDSFLNSIDKNHNIILLCQNGNRSELAVGYVTKKGFRQTFHLQNGIESLEIINNGNR